MNGYGAAGELRPALPDARRCDRCLGGIKRWSVLASHGRRKVAQMVAAIEPGEEVIDVSDQRPVGFVPCGNER
jgi:hypothetical protein